ncbi:MAG: electron transfer flavoprotein subunit beta/FixA family protein [Flavobacteriales bacterium]
MKILVCISKAPDTTSKIAFTNNNTSFDENGVQFIVNPYDEWYALVRALEIKETQGAEVTIITVGPSSDEAIMRKALAIGADNAIRIDAEPSDAYFVAQQLAEHAKSMAYDLILTGKETINFNGSQIGGMLAECLEVPYVSVASKLAVEGPHLRVEREITGGIEVLQVSLPAVVSCAKGMAEQRIPNMRGIMAARTKPLEVKPAHPVNTLTHFSAYASPQEKSAVKIIDANELDTLVSLLHNEAKVI